MKEFCAYFRTFKQVSCAINVDFQIKLQVREGRRRRSCMKNDLWLGFEECRVDLVFVCDVHFIIFDGGVTILNDVQIEDRDLRRRVKVEQ
jgi:hypothetical protein